MLSSRSARHLSKTCSRSISSAIDTSHHSNRSTHLHTCSRLLANHASSRRTASKPFSTSARSYHEALAVDRSSRNPEEIEKIVRDAKQRFRDTLPKGYLNAEEYQLYERLYGAPLRETEPEDVGIHTHVRVDNNVYDGRPIYGEDFVRVRGTEEVEPGEDPLPSPELLVDLNEAPGDYVGYVARNKREYDALKKLENDFKAAALQAKEEDAARDFFEPLDEQSFGEELDHEEGMEESEDQGGKFDPESAAYKRLHDYTVAGHFRTYPSTLQMPKATFVQPITDLLSRTDISHIKQAAEAAFGGTGIPDSSITPPGQRSRPMVGLSLQAAHHRMSKIDADVFISTVMPQTFASSMSTLVEVRKRLGKEWLRNLILRDGGPRILDAGTGGASLAAWQQVLQAEWETMCDEGIVEGMYPPSKKTVVAGSDNLRQRVSRFLFDTTFLPRLPDYHHSADNAERLLDGPQVPQSRKMYDVIIASQLLLPVAEPHRRKAVLNQLWSLLSPEGGVLIVIEKGHPRGFEAVADVRQRLLDTYFLKPGEDTDTTVDANEENPTIERVREPGMIIAPCTNHSKCPMYLIPGKSKGRKDVCSFSQRFIRPPFLHKIMDGSDRNHDDIEFSYIAVQRGVSLPSEIKQNPASTDAAFAGYENSPSPPNPLTLPRNISRPLKRHGHILLDLCTPAGNLERWIVPKSQSKQAYHDARKASWGDLWALGAKTRVPRKVRLGKGAEVPDDGGARAKRAHRTKDPVVEVGVGPGGVVSAMSRKPDDDRRLKGSKKQKRRKMMEGLKDDSRKGRDE